MSDYGIKMSKKHHSDKTDAIFVDFWRSQR